MFTFSHRNPEMHLDKQHTALVLADMQNEFLEEQTRYLLRTDRGLSQEAPRHRKSGAPSQNCRNSGTTSSIRRTGIIQPISSGPFLPVRSQTISIGIGFCGRKDPVDLEGFHGSRATPSHSRST